MALYLPPHFEETNLEAIDGLIAAHPLATIVASTTNGLSANHIPVMRSTETTLIGHVALANDMHRLIADGTDVLAIFHGDDSYVSPNWYPTKVEHHRHVPTWNYQIVHIHGQISFHRDTKTKRAIVGRLTQRHERITNGDKAWRMADAPSDYMDEMIDKIVGFEIAIGRIVAKSKLSQNREAVDHASVADELRAHGHEDLASAMTARK